jgi:hypothetical protein
VSWGRANVVDRSQQKHGHGSVESVFDEVMPADRDYVPEREATDPDLEDERAEGEYDE